MAKKARFLRSQTDRARVFEGIARMHSYPSELIAEKLMLKSRKIAQSDMPLSKKAEELARTGLLIRRNVERGIIPWKTGRALLKALQEAATNAISEQAIATSKQASRDLRFFDALEKMVLNRAIAKNTASRVAADYLGLFFAELPIARANKPLEWKMNFLEGMLGLLRKEAARFKFSQSTIDARTMQLKELTEETIEREALKVKPAIDRNIFEMIKRAKSLGLLNAQQAYGLEALAIKTQIENMIAKRTSTLGYIFLEQRIRRLPKEFPEAKRLELLKLAEELHASFRRR